MLRFINAINRFNTVYCSQRCITCVSLENTFNIVAMPIVDKELIGEGSSGEFEIPDVPLGVFIDESIRNNVAAHGKAKWLVSLTFLFNQ